MPLCSEDQKPGSEGSVGLAFSEGSEGEAVQYSSGFVVVARSPWYS